MTAILLKTIPPYTLLFALILFNPNMSSGQTFDITVCHTMLLNSKATIRKEEDPVKTKWRALAYSTISDEAISNCFSALLAGLKSPGKHYNIGRQIYYASPVFSDICSSKPLENETYYGGYYVSKTSEQYFELTDNGIKCQPGGLTTDEKELLIGIDTTWSEDQNTAELIAQVSPRYFTAKNIVGFSFLENWKLNQSFIKRVNVLSYETAKETKTGHQSLLSFHAAATKAVTLIAQDVKYTVKTRPSNNVEENWSVFQNAATDDYIPTSAVLKLKMWLAKGYKAGTIDAVQLQEHKSFDRLPRLSYEQINNITMRHDTIWTGCFEPPDATIVRNDRDSRSPVAITFIEDWYAEPGTLGIVKRVKGIAFVYEVMDDAGEVVDFKTLDELYFRIND